MIKSNRNMRDIVPFDRLKPAHAEGHIRIELTDPVTGKVKDRIDGKNHVFTDMLFMGMLTGANSNPTYRNVALWNDLNSGISVATLSLNDDGSAINPKFPLLRGQTIGYGRPGQGSRNSFRGAYNAANQTLGDTTLTKTRWKFQYDFTTAQANSGIIRNMGLTLQYDGGVRGISKHAANGNATMAKSRYGYCSDGRYSAWISYLSTDGVVTVADMRFGVESTINLSAIIGVTGAEYKQIGYEPSTGKWYIYRYSATPANRRVWVFTDQTFSNLEATYTPTNVAISRNEEVPFYVYSGKMYCFHTNSATSLGYFAMVADFVNNVAITTIPWAWDANNCNNAIWNEGQTTSNNIVPGGRTIGTPDGVWLLSGSGEAYFFYDCVNDKKSFFKTYQRSALSSFFFHPLLTEEIPTVVCRDSDYNNILASQQGALTTYILPTPIQKTSANGMTVTYELEVFW